jgi:hypothetical protein
VREESHLDDMRAAIRGDFERLQERLGEQKLMRLDETAEREPEPEPELESESDGEADAREDISHDTAPATEPEPRGEAADNTSRSWLDRLLGR